MKSEQRVIYLTILMAGIALAVAAVAICLLYEAAFDSQRNRLTEIVQSQAKLIDAIGDFAQLKDPRATLESQLDVTLKQIQQAHFHFTGLGKTGEFALARKKDDEMVFLLNLRHLQITQSLSIPMQSNLAEPMRLAINGHSGSIVGLDYRGQQVLAAYEPLSHMRNLGIVAKIDMKEIRDPFERAAIVTIAVTLLLVFAGAWLFRHLGNPLIQSISDVDSRLKSVLSTAVDAIITINDQGIIDSFNRTAEEMFGFKASEVHGLNVNVLMPNPDAERHDAYLSHYQLTGKRKIIGIGREVTAKKKDGSLFPVILAVSETKSYSKTIYTGVIRDLTETKRRQQELLQAENEARQHRDRLAHVDRITAMGELTASLAHEINQPLTAIATYTEASIRMIEAGMIDDEDMTKTLLKVANQAHRAGEVIRRLRSFIKQQDSTRSLICCEELIEDVVGLVETDARLNNIRLDVSIAANLPRLFIDAIQLQQVLLNLVKNAIEAMQRVDESKSTNHPTEIIHIQCTIIDDDYIEIRVSDSGIGIGEIESNQLFDPFFTTKTTGMGLGLAISRSIINAHGGELNFENNTPCGAIFYFTLPVADEFE